jgi:hypothetical protein
MKKLILILFLIFASYGCVRISKAEGLKAPQMNSFQDTNKSVAELDTTIDQKDSIRKSKKSLTVTKLDTVSVLPDIRKNMEVMKYQQKQLDSLLVKRKK